MFKRKEREGVARAKNTNYVVVLQTGHFVLKKEETAFRAAICRLPTQQQKGECGENIERIKQERGRPPIWWRGGGGNK